MSFAATALFVASWTPDWLAIDTAQTLSVARNIAAHGEIATDVVYYEEHLQFSNSRVPQTVFPPGYPALIAALMTVGVSEVTAALILVAASLAIIPLLLMWILRDLGLHTGWAAIISLSWLIMQPMWWNAQGLQSELPFIFCTLGSYACLLRSNQRQGGRWLLAAGLLTALACTIRYAGVFFALAVGLVLAIDWLVQRDRRTFLRVAGFCSPPCLALAAMFARNAALVGDLKGGNNHLVTKPVGDVLRTMWYSLSDLWGWSRAGLLAGEASELLLLVALALFAGLMVKSLLTHRRVQPHRLSGNTSAITQLIPLTYGIVSIACLFWLERTTSVGVGPRLLLPIVPFLLIAFGQMFMLSMPQRPTRTMRSLPATLVVLAIFTGQFELWAHHRHPSALAQIRTAIETLSEQNHELAWSELVALADGRPILCNECHCVSNFTRLPVVGLAAEVYTSREWNHETVRDLVDQFDVRLVLVFTEVFDEANESTGYFERLSEGDVPDWLRLVIADGPMRAYVVRQ